MFAPGRAQPVSYRISGGAHDDWDCACHVLRGVCHLIRNRDYDVHLECYQLTQDFRESFVLPQGGPTLER